jgi:DNA replication and repair protein RecF
VARHADALAPAFARMAAGDLVLNVEYVPGGSADSSEAETRLVENRRSDLRRKSARFGPHRDDVAFQLDGRTARRHASQGQQRILTLALKSAELECVRQARGAHPVLLLDDVSSELDPTRIGAVYSFLRDTPSQVFVTTTRPELFVTPGIGAEDRADWRLESGDLVGS